MIQPILPAALAVRGDPGDFVNNAAKESAKRTASHLAETSALIARLVGEGKVKVAAAIYDLQSGVVTYLD
jgi:carbonic anhydrase